MASLITALTAVGALVFTNLSLRATQAQIAVAEQGQITDRYTKAVAQLDQTGPGHLQARLGAIYALERLAHDSPRDQPTIIEILSAFIRSTRTRVPTAPVSRGACPEQELSTDTRAALVVLGRRDTSHDNNTTIDLSSTCFDGADMGKLRLKAVNLTRSHFGNADLGGTDLSGASIDLAGFGGVNLGGAKLGSATLIGTDLSGANLGGADLTGAKLVNADLSGAYLYGADLSGATLFGADLSGAKHDAKTLVAAVLTYGSTKGAWW
ncbi:pentapeptide repeat-containing protein [Amycolatopsis sp. NPDC059021]|uniref:pentapeptide repeat-containing protein n=1 Tax=Amycolatopsis sp. NPDC059021 TaxID=3346704 RepID=UPI00366E1638